MTKKKTKSIGVLPLNILAMLLIWVLLTFTDTISPQFQIRPVAEFANRLLRREQLTLYDYYGSTNDWTYQGEDYMYWDRLMSIFHKGEE